MVGSHLFRKGLSWRGWLSRCRMGGRCLDSGPNPTTNQLCASGQDRASPHCGSFSARARRSLPKHTLLSLLQICPATQGTAQVSAVGRAPGWVPGRRSESEHPQPRPAPILNGCLSKARGLQKGGALRWHGCAAVRVRS